MNWSELCTTCREPYVKDGFTVCSNSFHGCRDCQWFGGRVKVACPEHMRNLMMFFGSCGHTTIEELTDEQWERYAYGRGFGGLGELEPNRYRVGSKTRMVYVNPGRYCVCKDCFEEEWADLTNAP